MAEATNGNVEKMEDPDPSTNRSSMVSATEAAKNTASSLVSRLFSSTQRLSHSFSSISLGNSSRPNDAESDDGSSSMATNEYPTPPTPLSPSSQNYEQETYNPQTQAEQKNDVMAAEFENENENDDPFAVNVEEEDDDISTTSSPVSEREQMERDGQDTFVAPLLSRYRSSYNNPLGRTGSGGRAVRGNANSDSSSSDDDSSSSSYSEEDPDDEFGGVKVNDWLDEEEVQPIAEETASELGKHRYGSASSASTMHQALSSHSLVYGTGPNTGRVSGGSSSNSLRTANSWMNASDDAEDDTEDDDDIELSVFLQENMPVYEVMRQVQLFRNLSQNQQEEVVKALKPASFHDGQVIVEQGTKGSRFYMIASGEAVVTKKNEEGQERMVTRLQSGNYFGELALIYDDPRSATVRAAGDVELLYLTQKDFQHINQVHLSLMLQQVPILARLSGQDQDSVLSRLQPANFSDGEYIVKQGEQGSRFYMITKGEAVVMEFNSEVHPEDGERELTRLYEGHVFGEMSLIYSEPRTASVRAIGPVKCLYLSKEDFDECLLSDHFHRFIQESYIEKATRRAMRLRMQQRAMSNSRDSGTSSSMAEDANSALNMSASTNSGQGEHIKATETKKLVKQRLKNGQKVVNKYIIQRDLGKGTFGRVKLCQSEEDGHLYAVKIMHKSFMQRMAGKEDQLHDAMRREVAIMKKLNHRNVVKLVEVIDDPSSQKVYLVQEYVQHNLMTEINKSAGLEDETARKYLRDLLCGIHYLHFNKVIHRDIKPENILVSDEGVAKIADFGTARMIMNESETLQGAKGTPAFMAPEMFNIDATYMGSAVDVWSLGATLFMMICGRPPWLAENEIVLAEKVQNDELKFPSDIEYALDPHLKNLIQRMLTKDADVRISLNDCIYHDWVTKEGSEPLGLQGEENILTVSVDDTDQAIENIPEQIDQSLTERLKQANLLVKTRQQGRNSTVLRSGSGQTAWDANRQAHGTSTSNLHTHHSNSQYSTTGSNGSGTSQPSRGSSNGEVSRVIHNWRRNKRLQAMYGQKDLSERSRELLMEQRHPGFTADRANVTEIILPAANPTSRSRYPSTSSINTNQPRATSDSSSPTSAPGSPARVSNSRSSSIESNPLPVQRHNSGRFEYRDSGNLEGFGRTSFTSVSRMSDGGVSNSTMDEIQAARESLASDDQNDMSHNSYSSFHTNLSRESGSDAALLKRSLSRKKDFLMVTSEVFRGEEGDYQSRKVLFQAKDDDFSVASRIPSKSMSGRDSVTSTSRRHSSHATTKASGSRKSSSFNNSMGSMGSSCSDKSGPSYKKPKKSMSKDEVDLGDIEFEQVSDDEDEDDDEEEEVEGSIELYDSSSDEGSEYSDVECDVDVEATFDELIGSPNLTEYANEDEELMPVDASTNATTRGSASSSSMRSLLHMPSYRSIVQVYVSSKIRENLNLRIRAGYAEAKGQRQYMEDRSLSIADVDFNSCPPALTDAFENLGYFAVYDGHNGTETVEKLQEELHERFFEHLHFASNPMAAMAQACEDLDHDMLQMQNSSMTPDRRCSFVYGDGFIGPSGGDVASDDEEQEEVTEATDDLMLFDDDDQQAANELEASKPHIQPISFSGAVAVFVVVAKKKIEGGFIEEDENEEEEETKSSASNKDSPTVLYIGNTGDCRAVLSTAEGVAVDITKDHKASDAEEKKRIEESGGFVHNGRLDGILAISRGFGDLAHKQEGHLIVTPDLYEHAVTDEDEFMLLASDGIFDVITSQQAVNFVRRKLRMHGDVQLAAQELLQKAQAYYAHDNLSVVLIALNQNEKEPSV